MKNQTGKSVTVLNPKQPQNSAASDWEKAIKNAKSFQKPFAYSLDGLQFLDGASLPIITWKGLQKDFKDLQKKNANATPKKTVQNVVKKVSKYNKISAPASRESTRVSRGNGSVSYVAAAKYFEKISKIVGKAGDILSISESFVYESQGKHQEAKLKRTEIATSKATQFVMLRVAGKICPKVVKGLTIKDAIAGTSCFIAFSVVSDEAGERIAKPLQISLDLIDEQAKKNEGKVFEPEDYEHDVLLHEWNPTSD